MFKHAFECRKCPQGNSENGCPAWWEIVTENTQTGEVKVSKGCGWQHLPMMLIEVIKASNRPAAAVESCRNEISKGFENLGQLHRILRAGMPVQLLESKDEDTK